MPIPWGPIAGAAGNIIGGLFGRSGQSSANQANARLAAQNREFQREMSNTAYQRAAKDLDKAGLNRILAIGSPATTPGGNVATMQNEQTPLAEGIKGGTAQALAARQIKANIRNVNARTELTNAQRRALGGAAEVGSGIEEIIVNSKERLGNLDWKSMKDQLGRDTQSAGEYIRNIAETVGITGHKGERLILQVVNQMDLPKMTDEQKLAWAKQNPEKIQRYLERNKK